MSSAPCPQPPASAPRPLDVGTCATLACLWESIAAKPGNVYRGADFEDASYADFATSAAVVGPILQRAAEVGVGATVLAAVRATRQAVGTNTNLGTLLLLAPLAAVGRNRSIAEGIAGVLAKLDENDAGAVYEAIRISAAGGLGRVEQSDVHSQQLPKGGLLAAMRLAANRDSVARQYANEFYDVQHRAAAWLTEALDNGNSLCEAIVRTHLRLLAELPDSLIARKCGQQFAEQVSARAAAVLDCGGHGNSAYDRGLADLDFWLRADGHRRNPGTTADLIAAGLFVLLRENRLDWPARFY